MNNKVKILILFLVIAIIGAAVAFFMYNKPHESLSGKEAKYNLSPSKLISAFESDEKTAQKKYKDQLLKISGTVASISISENSASLVFANEGGMNNVKAGIISESLKRAKELSKGDPVTVKGRLTGFSKFEEMGISMIDIEISRSIIVEE